MIYKFNKKSLTYENISNRVVLVCVLIILVLTSIFAFIGLKRINDVSNISNETKAIIIKENTKFSKDKLKEYILDLNIRFPHIVFAQAILETNEFKSNLFKENSNLFGMKEATKRPTTNSGVENGHAYYNSWRESVQDYAMFAAAYLNNLKTEEEYFQYLRANYAEDSEYVEKLKKIIKEFNTINLVNSK
jgi:uncharacterized FlgJ-related protein